MVTNRKEILLRAVGVVGLLALGGCASQSASGAPGPESTPVSRAADWSVVETLIEGQKYREATEELARLRAAAEAAGASADWTRALVKEVQLTAALGGVETALRHVRDTPWPDDPEQQTVLKLLYADSLAKYLDRYSYEIGQRERVGSVEDNDLKQWTRSQIADEIGATFGELWEARDAWGERPLGELSDHFRRGGYPDRIRGTLRDIIAYLWAEFLSNTAYWEPAENNSVFRLDLAALAAGEANAGAHPLERLCALMGELERWHTQGGRPEAAFEALLERIERLRGHATNERDRSVLKSALGGALDALDRELPWWSVGQAKLAQLVQADDDPSALVRARDLAAIGEAAHPDTLGGQRCASIRESLEAPSMSLVTMEVDGAGKRSLQVTHRNLEVVHLRAYSLDLDSALSGGDDYDLLPRNRQIDALLEGGEPSHEWRVELPPTPDLREHSTYVTPPFDETGLYVVVASARADFAKQRNRLQAVNLILSDLVVLARSDDGAVTVDVRSGATGAALQGVAVQLWHLDYRKGHRKGLERATDRFGRVRMRAGGGFRGNSLVVARHEDDMSFRIVWVDRPHRSAPRDSTEALIFTDRSIYRPDQEIEWKIVAYDRLADEERLQVAAKRTVTVDLMDANWDVLESREVETNDYGSAWGTFTVPTGRLLGAWALRTSLGGQSSVQVEEYKRPTFEVALEEPSEALRLNRAARITGDAQYYFGLPVVEGSVEWSVSRRPRYPRWWGWYRAIPQGREQLLAGGEAALDADGRFEFEFTPAADERKARDGVTYSYAVTVHVTDAGGETRSADRTYQLGFVAVRAALSTEAGFLEAGRAAAFDVRRTDLDGTPRAGSGRWRLAALVPPGQTLLPAELPVQVHDDAGDEVYRTDGDRLRPRWSALWTLDRELRTWPEGNPVASGSVEHGENGSARIELESLDAGAHRLYYETDDVWGGTFETQHDFVVAGDGELPLSLVLAIDRPSVPAGETARLLVHSGFSGLEMLLEVARPGRPVETRRLSGGTARTIELEVEPADRSGIEVRLTAVRDHQFLSRSARIVVPPENTDLTLRFASFRDRIRPGGRESWRVIVSGADGEALAPGVAEVLGYMYDRSLDLFATHRPPRPAGFGAGFGRAPDWSVNLGAARAALQWERDWYAVTRFPHLHPDRLVFFDDYGIGGPGSRRLEMFSVQRMGVPAPPSMSAEMAAPTAGVLEDGSSTEERIVVSESPPIDEAKDGDGTQPPAEEPSLRSDFSETAFWEPHLVTGRDGSVVFEFTVPDSVTEWNVWVHALTKDLTYGSLHETTRSAKELLVRPYLPRFLREGDEARLRVVVQNAGEETFSGSLDFDLTDPDSEESVAGEFGLADGERLGQEFTVEPGGSATLTFPVLTPTRVGAVAVRAMAEAGDYSDGELRLLPLLPGRFHLLQSRFAALQDKASRELVFEDLAADSDPTRIDEQLVVTLDAQLFYSVLSALPYLADFPYECTEQTLNRFLSTGIVTSVFDDYPAVARMAAQLAERETPLEPWVADDPNRRMALEETPWLRSSRGGETDTGLARILDPRVARLQRDAALARLVSSQTSSGGFPW